MSKKHLYILFISLSASFLLISCKKWLDVAPEDRIIEKKLFANTQGFYAALNGAYIELASQELYGSVLSGQLSDILAQYYDTKISDAHQWGPLASFSEQSKQSIVNPLWAKAYSLIGHINLILEHCNTSKVLNAQDKSMIMGECYGLRALLHFELYRIFGHETNDSGKYKKMPYKISSQVEVLPSLSSANLLIQIIGDLKTGEELLKPYDPVATNKNQKIGDYIPIHYQHRQLRMNYYALKAIRARILLYKGDKKGAYQCVSAMLDEATQKFPFAKEEDITGQGSTAYPDRTFSSELIFSVYNSRRMADLQDRLFSYRLPLDKVLYMGASGYFSLFAEESDLRTNQWQAHSNIEGEIAYFLIKYTQVADGKLNSLVPVIRLPELYLIAAETAPNEGMAFQYLNKLRKARQVTSLSSQLEKHIEEAYAREFAGEGQLFWFYKRKHAEHIPIRYKSNAPMIDMKNENYSFTVPNTEKEHKL